MSTVHRSTISCRCWATRCLCAGHRAGQRGAGLLFALLVNRSAAGASAWRGWLSSTRPSCRWSARPRSGCSSSRRTTASSTRLCVCWATAGPQNWTGNPDLALMAVMIVAVWKNAGYYMIFYLAGLQNLPARCLRGRGAWTARTGGRRCGASPSPCCGARPCLSPPSPSSARSRPWTTSLC